MRRILIAGLLAVLFGSTTAIGLAQAEGGADAWTGLGEAKDGDVYVYEGHHEVTYRLTGGAMVLAPDGMFHQARWLRDGLAVGPDFRVLQSMASTGTQSTSGGGSQSDSALVSWHLGRNELLPCGMITSLREGGAPVAIDVEGTCGATRLSLLEQASVDDRPARVYGAGTTKVAYAAGIPVPVHIDVDGDVTRLVGYASGDASFEPSYAAPVRPVASEPVTRYGPVGVEGLLPFTLESAMDVAARPDQPTAAFLAAHPDWVLVSAAGAVRSGPNWQDVLWSVHVQEGTDAVHMTIIRSQDATAGQALLASSSDQVYTRDVEAIEDLHDALPTVASSLEWLEAMGETDVRDVRFTRELEAPYEPFAVGSAPLMAFAASGSGLTPREPADEDHTGLSLMFAANGRLEGKLDARTTYDGTEPSAPSIGPMKGSVTSAEAFDAQVLAASSAAGLLVAAAYYFAPMVKGGLGAVLFHRRATEHPARQQILNAVVAQPGIHYRGLDRALGMGQGALEHHLRVLVREGHLRRRDEGGYACYYVGRPARPLPKSGGGRQVLAAVEAGPASITQLAERTGLSPSTVAYHVRRLEQDACVRTERQGRTRLVLSEA